MKSATEVATAWLPAR